MSISYFGAGVLVQDAASISPTYPASTVAGQLAVLVVVSGTSAESTPSTPSGWTLAATLSGGGGTWGSGTGPRRLTIFVRVLAGGDAAPTTAVPSGTGSLIAGQIHVLARSAGTGWRWTATAGVDASSGTGFSAPCPDTPTWAVGDMTLVGYALPVSTASLTVEAVAATGITFGTMTERADAALTPGNVGRVGVTTQAVTAGSGTQAPTVAATLAAASTGVAGVLRVREAAAALTAAPQTAFPPRTLVTLTGMSAGDTVTASIYRTVGDDQAPVRAATSVDVTGLSALLRVDAEQPLGVPVGYAADLTDVNGDVWTVTAAGTITSTADGDVISDAVQGVGTMVTIESGWEKSRSRDATTMNVGGRLVTVSRRRATATATVTVRTETDAASDAMQQVLTGATEGVVQIRKQVTMARVDGHYAVTDDVERPHWYDELTWWDLTTAEADPWPDALEAAGFTLADLAAVYPGTLADIAAAYTTLLAIAQADLGA
ncbi:hypothetical protein [Streptomyces sp. NPDC021224]|uniref:hypothetical protein n=1 Tax=unclassified Streptomyces TaxID=2593676 RepID=UPI0037B93E29